MTMTEMEKRVFEMVKNGEPIHGWAREVLMEITLRELEEKGGKE